MSDTFKTTEDELNFILGNDVGQSFDIDAALDKDDEDLPAPGDAAPAAGARADLQGDTTWLPSFARPPRPVREGEAGDFGAAFAAADCEPTNDDFARGGGLSSASPAFALDGDALGDALLGDAAFRESPATSEGGERSSPAAKSAPPPEELEDFRDFDLDAVDDVRILASLRALDDFKNEPFEPLANLGHDPQNYHHLNFPQSLQESLSPSPPSRILAASNTTAAAAAATTKAQNGPAPIVHSAHEPMAPPEHSPRKRRAEAATAGANLPFERANSTLRKRLDLRPLILEGRIDPAATEVRADEARLARRKRRRLRAKSQAVNLVGGGNVCDIRRRAVEDSTKFEPQLLSEFARTFNPETYVDVTFDQAYRTMVETSRAREAEEVATVLGEERKYARSPRPTRISSDSRASASENKKKKKQSPAKKGGRTSAEAAVVVAPPEKNAGALRTLPDGKDPESRHLRRLMRNRLSAQASRDRRKKAVEDARHSKAAKEAEIEELERTMSKEAQRMQMLERALRYARDYLGPDRYSKVATATSTTTGGVNAGQGANVIQSR